MRNWLLLALVAHLGISHAFLQPTRHLGRVTNGFGLRSSDFSEDSSAPLGLPPASSYSSSSTQQFEPATSVVDRKFSLLFTCNICETRNQKRVSRLAYQQGVVICTCQGCDVQHLIADHLGFTNLYEENMNLETILDVARVSQDVFNLEQSLDRTSDDGSMVDSQGNRFME